MSPIRLGIVGTGLAVERLHLPALSALKGLFEIQAIAGRNAEKTQLFAKGHGIPNIETDAEAILHRADVDAVLLCLPIELNAEWATKALLAGKPAMAEKPIAANRAEAEALVQACERPGAPCLMIAENYLFWPHMAEAIRLVKDGSLGQPRLGVVHQIQNATRGGEWLTSWRVAPQFEGGFVLDGGVHWAALLNAMLGRPAEVLARTSTFDASLPPIDTSAALITYECGARVLWGTAYSATPSNEALLTLHGSEGSVAIFWDRAVWKNAEGREQVFASPSGGYDSQWRHFHQVLTQGEPLAYTSRQAAQDLDLMLKLCGK
ncbi:MAG TPA: Gfo/Idh/MocA family oxidoreductase [Holophaga sp.]|nr:Gfo/Idh/MocA family oxidoreductase [Holophaga sp.]